MSLWECLASSRVVVIVCSCRVVMHFTLNPSWSGLKIWKVSLYVIKAFVTVMVKML